MDTIKPKYIVLTAVIIISLSMGMVVISWFGSSGTDTRNVLGVPPEMGGDFELTGPGKARVKLTDFRGKLVLVFFGYTYCPDVCPTALLTLNNALKRLPETDRKRVQVIMISVDPERDTAKSLETFVKYFNPDFIGLTGTAEEIAQVAKNYLAYYEKQPGGTKISYQVGHSAFTYLLDGQGKVLRIFRQKATPKEIARVLQKNLASL